jgi:hypothetical protein
MPLSAGAASEWATWSNVSGTFPPPTVSTGSFTDGRSVTATGFILNPRPPDGFFTSDPIIPGQPDGQNPGHLAALTAISNTTLINAGDLIMTIDLTGFPVDAETTFGFADLFSSDAYRLELLDSSLAPLSLADLQLASYNVTYPGPIVADLNISLNTATGALRVDRFAHDGGGSYAHSGFTTFTNLPLNTARIRLLADGQQAGEGIGVYIGGSATAVPAPAAGWLFGTAFASLVGRRLRRRSRSS